MQDQTCVEKEVWNTVNLHNSIAFLHSIEMEDMLLPSFWFKNLLFFSSFGK